MQTENPYQPSAASTPAKRSEASRAVLIYLISGFCLVQFSGVVLFMAKHSSELSSALDEGSISLVHLALGVVQPLLLFLAGFLLFFRKKMSVLFFSAYLVWSLVKAGISGQTYFLSLVAAAGFTAYSLHLLKRGKLR